MGFFSSVEQGLVDETLAFLGPDKLRDVLLRYLCGATSAPITLVALLSLVEGPAAVRAVLEFVSLGLSASGSKTETSRSKLENLQKLLDGNKLGCSSITEILEGIACATASSTLDAGIASCRKLFDDSVARNEEASVALYSLGSPAILAEATGEIVTYFARLGVLSRGRSALEIGCGIGRLVEALAPALGAIEGIDVSSGMIAAARRRTATLTNVRLALTEGRDLGVYGDGMFDLVYAVDVFPYLVQVGESFAADHFAECARVLAAGGDLLILNYSYRNDLSLDRRDVERLAELHELSLVRSGEHPFSLWDGAVFHLVRG